MNCSLLTICLAGCVVEMYWTAPELLRQVGLPVSGTPKGDIYSFAIIMWQLMYNSKACPYNDINLEPKGLHTIQTKPFIHSLQPQAGRGRRYCSILNTMQKTSLFLQRVLDTCFLQRLFCSCGRLSKGNSSDQNCLSSCVTRTSTHC